MATIAEKTANASTLLDDLASLLLGLTDGSGNAVWTDADTYVVNDNSTSDWHNNGRVLYHEKAGMYLLMYLHGHSGWWEGSNYVSGLRVCHCSDWDSTNHHPAGKTDVTHDDPFSNDVGNTRSDTFNTETKHGDDAGPSGLWMWGSSVSEPDFWISTSSNDQFTYFASAGVDYFTVAAWNTEDVNNGACGWFSWEYMNDKFWNDGRMPYCSQSSGNPTGDGHDQQYGFEWYQCDDHNLAPHPFSGGTGADRGNWGYINEDPDDDTFFFRRPVLYSTSNKDYPIGYSYAAASNDQNEGANHGDTVTYDGMTYRALRSSGASRSELMHMLLRYE